MYTVAEYAAFEAELLGRFKAAYRNVDPALLAKIMRIGGPSNYAEISVQAVDGSIVEGPTLVPFNSLDAIKDAWEMIQDMADQIIAKSRAG